MISAKWPTSIASDPYKKTCGQVPFPTVGVPRIIHYQNACVLMIPVISFLLRVKIYWSILLLGLPLGTNQPWVKNSCAKGCSSTLFQATLVSFLIRTLVLLSLHLSWEETWWISFWIVVCTAEFNEITQKLPMFRFLLAFSSVYFSQHDLVS